ncbi:ABC transporter permease [Hoeflea sp. G2-23]|uniref:ABC transporter permease n=1 Tax=Hoeflea algicola TaxID=2983763 RepID=A0ABT3ZEB2_9HYPH|nr:ABC transporter permease [Hoeflea algicola]MCY0150137.1 ABC transporter permease [Hoeflea algicola]
MSFIPAKLETTPRRSVGTQPTRNAMKFLQAKLLVLPAVLVIGIFLVVPLLIIVTYSFLEPATFGGVVWTFSTEAYTQFLFERDIFDDTLAFNTSYLQIFSRSVFLAVTATVISLIIGFPTAYFIATRSEKQKNILIFLITLPFWTNLLIRTYCVLLILRDDGIVNSIAIGLNIYDTPVTYLYNNFAMGAGLVYSYLPFMILPLYANLERMDKRVIEAAYDLYATPLRVFTHVILPHARSGIIGGCLLVFIPSLGTYLVPDMLGGGGKLLIGNLIAMQFGMSRNWPFGAALAVILLAAILVVLMVAAGRIRASRAALEGH